MELSQGLTRTARKEEEIARGIARGDESGEADGAAEALFAPVLKGGGLSAREVLQAVRAVIRIDLLGHAVLDRGEWSGNYSARV